MSDDRDGIELWPRRKKNHSDVSIEAINWMRSHTIEDLREITADTKERGGDVSTLKRLLTNLEQMQFAMMKPSQADIEFEEHHHVMERHNLRPIESFD